MAGLVPFNRNKSDLSSQGFRDFYNMIENFFDDSYMPGRRLMHETFKLDVQEKEDEYSVEAELPGAKKEDVKIEINDNRLSIQVTKDEKTEEENKNYIHRERRMTSMQRYIYLKDASSEGVKAKLDNGILSIVIPKLENKEKKNVIDIE